MFQSIGTVQILQDETTKDADQKLMTFVNVRGVSFVYDIKSQRSKQDRCAEGIVDAVDRNVEQLTIGGVKVIAYGSDNCNLMNKVRCIIVAKCCIWGIGCIMHVVQNTFVGIIKLDMLGIQEARESVSKLLINYITHHYYIY